MRELQEALKYCQSELTGLQDAVFRTPPKDYASFMEMAGKASQLISMIERFKEIIYGREQDL